ncbi:MAG: amino acid adenylation domain-containing protein, partial [Acidobacteriota bacterium]
MDRPADRLKHLSPEKRALLLKRLGRKRAEAPPDARAERSAALPRQPRSAAETAFPLSFAQERLWFFHRLEPESVAYNEGLLLILDGALDAERLRRAFARTLRRHEVLRSRFVDGPDGPRQIVVPARPDRAVPLPRIDLRALTPDARRRCARRIAAARKRRRFDLERGDSLAALLLQLDDAQHQLALAVHHIVADGWSFGVLVGELAAAYRGGDAAPADDRALPVQYGDFAVWQRQRQAEGAFARHLAHWRAQLDDAPRALELPLDRPRPAQRAFRGDAVNARLGRDDLRALDELARRARATRAMVMSAVFGLLLARLSATRDVVVGLAIADRPHPDLQGLIGFFVNTLALRLRFTAGAGANADAAGVTGLDAIATARAATLDAIDHQEVPFDQVVDAVQPTRDRQMAPLVQALFTWQGAAAAALPDLPGLRVSAEGLGAVSAKFDLTFAVTEDADHLDLRLEYDVDLIDRTTARRWLDQLRAIHADLCAAPERPIRVLGAIRGGARHQQLRTWNDRPWPTAAAARRHNDPPTLHGRVLAQARRTPSQPALVRADGATLDYATVAGRVLHLARRLRQRGVGRETRVGVLLPRTPDLPIAMLGVLAAGGAYVPLDPTYPPDRLAFMVADADAALVLTTADLGFQLAGALGDAPALALDALLPADAGHGAAGRAALDDYDPNPRVDAASLAYVLYTSGSTGRPKGVAVSHGAVVNFVDAADALFEPDDLEGVVASTSASFDVSVFELFAPLVRGGTVLMIDDPLALADVAIAGRARLMATVPSAMDALLRLGLPPRLRTVVLAGEAVPQALVTDLHAARPTLRVIDAYGPSETTTYSTFALLPRGLDGPPPIGRPLAGEAAYVLDRDLQPPPRGVVGELFLGAAGTADGGPRTAGGVARGYLGRPGLTATRFLPDPHADAPGRRMYRTGDRARFLADGRLAFLGRTDHQLKVRGFRVELGEIESALRRHPAVREAAVNVAAAGDALVGFVVPALADAPPDPAALRRHLDRSLPAYMVPSGWVTRDALPRLPNGKIDRAALRAHGDAQAGADAAGG